MLNHHFRGIALALLIQLILGCHGSEADPARLHEYAARGDATKVKVVLTRHPELVDAVDDYFFEGQTPLHTAAAAGEKEVVEVLLRFGADLRARTLKDGQTPLHLAARQGQIGVVEFFLKKGAKVDERDAYRFTPLHEAASRGHRAMVTLLLSEGADVNATTDQGGTALYFAASGGYREVASTLLEKGARQDLVSATYLGDLNYLRERLKKDARLVRVTPYDNHNTLLHIAAAKGHLNIVKLFLQYKADIDAESQGVTPLFVAAENGHRDVVAVLVSHGALVDRRNRREETALHAAIEKNRFAVVKLLLESKASVNIKDTAGHSPLHFAITYECSVPLVELLLQHGADVNAPDSEGKSPLRRAKHYRNGAAIAELLRRYGANERPDEGKGRREKSCQDLFLFFASGRPRRPLMMSTTSRRANSAGRVFASILLS